MNKKAFIILALFLHALATASQFNKDVLFDFECVDILTTPSYPNTFDFGVGVKTINFDATKQATAHSKGFINYYCEDDYVGVHFITDLFDPGKIGHADWSKYSENAWLTFRVNTNNGGPVSSSIGWDNGTYGEKYWASKDLIIDTQGEWKRYSIKLSDVVWRDNWGKGEITFPDLTIAPKTLIITFDDPDEDILITPHVNVSVDDIEIWDEPLNAPLKADAGDDVKMVCGASAQLSVSTNYQDSEKIFYLWTPSEGLSATDIPNPMVNATKNTTYTVQVITLDAGTVKDSVKVNVLPLAMTLSKPAIACGNTAQVTLNTNYTGTRPLKFKWTPSEGLSSDTIQNPFVTLNTPVKYTVQIKTPNGCTTDSSFVLNPSMIDAGASICMVTVNNDNKNVVVCQQEPASAIDSFYIYRESSTQTDQYDLIGKISNVKTNEFTDSTSNARVQSNKYKIAIKDVCGFITTKSPAHKTIHLMVYKGAGNSWNLMWEPYMGAANTIYKIFRGTTKTDLTQIGSSSASSISYTDVTAPAGAVYYQVAIELNESCTRLESGANASIRSNMIGTNDFATNTQEISMTETITFPNPATDVLHVKTSGLPSQAITVVDLYGRAFLCKPIDSQTISISHLPRGMYTLKIVDSGNTTFSKFVKE